MSSASKENAEKLLNLVLGFFPRVDAKASFLFALDSGLLGFLAINVHSEDFHAWFLVLPGAAAVLIIAAGLWFVFHCSFPALKGGAESLIYFREIARRTEANFVHEFTNRNDEDHARDLLGQVWQNSVIMTAKYDAIKIAFILTGIALLPWTTYLALAAAVHSGGLIFK
jgi:hypothetical protein